MDKKILPKVFTWMAIGLLVTFLTGFAVSMNENMLINIFSSASLIILLILEIAIVVILSTRIHKMSPTTARICFLLYSFITGLTFSAYFVVYELSSLIFIFLVTAICFGLFALLGATTKMDLTKMGTYLFMGLIAVIICSILNIFFSSTTFEIVISIIAVLVFVGYTAYDVKKIIEMDKFSMIPEDNLAIYGALELYLDFINLFVHLVELIGKSNDN